jgi:O-antigen/teichoic acid export membrane protein
LNLLELQKKILSVDLVKVFSLNAISTLIRMLTGFVSVKIISKLLGPPGIALIGQLANFVAMVIIIATAGITQGVTKYVSEFKDSPKLVKKYIETAFKWVLYCSLFCSVVLLLISSYLSSLIFQSEDYQYVFVFLGVVILLFALNNLLLAIINGFKKFKTFVVISICGSLVGLLFTLVLVYFWGLKGALISLMTYQSVMFFISLYILKRENWLKYFNIKAKIDSEITKKYLQYSLMAITTACTVPMAQLLIRTYVIKNISIDDAGYWEGMNRLASMYLMIITSSLAIYYLPRLSELKTQIELRKEIFKVYKFIMPLLFIGLVSLFFLREFIIVTLFSKSFLPMLDLFKYQLIGDFFKIASWILAFNMVAKSKTTIFILSEIIASASFILLSIYFVNSNGVVGITKAYMINYILYFLGMLYYFRKLIFGGKTVL